jgi:hypothetical protein
MTDQGLTDAYVKSKARTQNLQAEASREAKVMEGYFEYLRSGGERGRIHPGVGMRECLSDKVAKLIEDLHQSIRETSELRDKLKSKGYYPVN